LSFTHHREVCAVPDQDARERQEYWRTRSVYGLFRGGTPRRSPANPRRSRHQPEDLDDRAAVGRDAGGDGGLGGAWGEYGQEGGYHLFDYHGGTGGAPGKAVNLNGHAVTWLGGYNGYQIRGEVA